MLINECPALWCNNKQNIIGTYPERFNLYINGDKAEISIAVSMPQQGKGKGTQILTHLENELFNRNIFKIKAKIKSNNPERLVIIDWLQKHGYTLILPPGWSEQLLRQTLLLTVDLVKEL
jgi:Acetyltransferase (GNAT) family